MGGRRIGIASKGQASVTLGSELEGKVKQLASVYDSTASKVIRFAVQRYLRLGDDAHREDMGLPKNMKAGASDAIKPSTESGARSGS